MINALKDNDKCFSHAATLALNYREFGKSCRRMSKIKIFLIKIIHHIKYARIRVDYVHY